MNIWVVRHVRMLSAYVEHVRIADPYRVAHNVYKNQLHQRASLVVLCVHGVWHVWRVWCVLSVPLCTLVVVLACRVCCTTVRMVLYQWVTLYPAPSLHHRDTV